MESNDEQDAMKHLGDHCNYQLCRQIWHRLTTLKSGLFPPDLLLPLFPPWPHFSPKIYNSWLKPEYEERKNLKIRNQIRDDTIATPGYCSIEKFRSRLHTCWKWILNNAKFLQINSDTFNLAFRRDPASILEKILIPKFWSFWKFYHPKKSLER